MSNFVRPDSVRLTLTGGHEGDYIIVKRRLNAGEERRLNAALIKNFIPGQMPTLDPEQVGYAKVKAYLLDWGGVGFGPEKFNAGTIDDLDPDLYREIERAINAHEVDQAAQREAEKNGRDGATNSAVISPSAEKWGGPTVTSSTSLRTSTAS